MLRMNRDRLLARLDQLHSIGAAAEGGVSRIALTDEDRAGRDRVTGWMRQAGLDISIDRIGNVFGIRKGHEGGPVVMTGSHIDTVVGGGRLDGNYGVLAGLEVLETLREHGITTRKPLAVGFFTNEEGVRFTPDMMGSLVFAGGLSVEQALATIGTDGELLGDELRRIGYAGNLEPGAIPVAGYVELHVEQGPVLESTGGLIGAVENLQGIYWTEITVTGQANHAGTTPMELRKDAGHAAARLVCEVRKIADALDGQVATCGSVNLEPNVVNVIAGSAKITVDLRNSDAGRLNQAQAVLERACEQVTEEEGVHIERRELVRFPPVQFDAAIASTIEEVASERGYPVRRMTSGAGHDAQMIARVAPAAMIFVPSEGGVSHNAAESTRPEHLEAGANVLLDTMLRLAQ